MLYQDLNGFLILVPQVRFLPGAPIKSRGYTAVREGLFCSGGQWGDTGTIFLGKKVDNYLGWIR